MSEEFTDEMDKLYDSRDKRIRGLWLLAILLVLFIGFLLNDRSNGIQKESHWRALSMTSNDSAKFWRNKAGLAQAEIRSKEVDAETFRQAKEKESLALRQQVSDLKKDLSNLKSVTSISTETIGKVRTTVLDSLIYLKDSTTIKLRKSSYRDHWTDLSVTFSEDSALWKYKFKDSLSLVGYFKKDHWYSLRSKPYLNAQSFNPNSTITGLNNFTMQERVRSRFGVGPFIGIGINGRPQAGVGVFYRLFEF